MLCAAEEEVALEVESRSSFGIGRGLLRFCRVSELLAEFCLPVEISGTGDDSTSSFESCIISQAIALSFSCFIRVALTGASTTLSSWIFRTAAIDVRLPDSSSSGLVGIDDK